ncbi:hypothetical protein GCM10023318_51800 [Nocardia callitridis]|uniref:Uncharacterized protein n=1 Tax=Nocardia callitridis TaxID=648753 RepID=A0ABP9KTC8_9NOCA
MHFRGSRGTSPWPILWVFGALFGGAVLVLAILTVTHLGPSDEYSDNTEVPPPAAPTQPAPPPKPCFPLEPNC